MDFGQNQQMYQNNMYQGNGYQNMVAMRNLPRHKIITVNGRQGAESFQMGPDSNILLADKNDNIIWLVQTDGAGYKTVTPYAVTPYVEKPPVDVNVLEDRITNIENMLVGLREELINGKQYSSGNKRQQSTKGNAKQSTPAD